MEKMCALFIRHNSIIVIEVRENHLNCLKIPIMKIPRNSLRLVVKSLADIDLNYVLRSLEGYGELAIDILHRNLFWAIGPSYLMGVSIPSLTLLSTLETGFCRYW